MTAILPNPFTWKSNSKDLFLGYATGILQFTGKGAAALFTIESGQTPGYVNIKCKTDGKYLVKASGQTEPPLMIVATADTHNEDTTDEYCTLFETECAGSSNPTVEFRIRHVHSKLYLCPYKKQGLDGVLCALNSTIATNQVDTFTAVAPPAAAPTCVAPP